MSQTEPSDVQPPRRRLRRVALAALGLVLFAVAGVGGFRAWVYGAPPPDAPRVVLSIGADLVNDVGLHQAAYQAALTRIGARTEEVSPRDGRSAREILAHADALVLTGGGDVDPELYGGDPARAKLVDPARDAFEQALLREALARDLPVLAVCRGQQLLNVHLGGTLQTLEGERARTHGITARSLVAHEVEVRPGTRLAELTPGPRRFEVNSFHGQALDRLAPSLVVSALAPDGVIEAVELPDRRFVLGVQWHPELLLTDPRAEALWGGLVEEAQAHHEEAKKRSAARPR
ncbi:MAG: gamma-glutamyl-gamma-aminobutyrate hydrolase family protein [Planctomycetota bacterium]